VVAKHAEFVFVDERKAMNLGGFSFWKLIGVSAFKSRLSRRIGIPLTKRGSITTTQWRF
jgi:hypothetical protein